MEPSRRPTDGRYGENPNRLQHYYQYQVIMKPSPLDIQELYLDSLKSFGIDPLEHDIRFVEDDWESPTVGAWGLGWEVWLDGMEISQFTYFQQVGGFDLHPVSAELTYGTERIAMYIQGIDNVYDLEWTEGIKYGDIHHQSEVEWSVYNFETGRHRPAQAALRHVRGRRNPDGGKGPGAADLRPLSQVFPYLQPAERPGGDQRGRTDQLYRPGPESGPLSAEGYLRQREAMGYPLLNRK